MCSNCMLKAIPTKVEGDETCDNGHKLKVYVGNPYLAEQGVQGFYCNICREKKEGREIANGFARCDRCDYDACRSCVPLTE